MRDKKGRSKGTRCLSKDEDALLRYPPDHLDEWAKLTPEERLRRTLRLHRLRWKLLKLKK